MIEDQNQETSSMNSHLREDETILKHWEWFVELYLWTREITSVKRRSWKRAVQVVQKPYVEKP
jgi:hypothetical protein